MADSDVDVERAAIGWRIAKGGDDEDVADFALAHMDDLLTNLAHARQIVADHEEIEWGLLAELWAIADLPTNDLRDGAMMALRALERANRRTEGAVWRRFAHLEKGGDQP